MMSGDDFSSLTRCSTADIPRVIPKFNLDEVELGRRLGSGEFCSVYEVIEVKLLLQSRKYTDAEIRTREFMSTNYKRGDSGNQYRYALKKLSTDVDFRDICDLDVLGTEVTLLQTIEHPNIIKLRAISSAKDTKNKNYFLIIDRLSDLLSRKIYKDWGPAQRKAGNKSSPIVKMIKMMNAGKRSVIHRNIVIEKLYVAYDIASALRYLHSKRIIYRDLKPENIGFDCRGDVKLFDLGLSRELPAPEHECSEGLYLMTSSTGTLRYMAPEVVLGLRYSLSADVYSFGILLWELLTSQRPFVHMTIEYHRLYVVHKEKRPILNHDTTYGWPEPIISLVESCWQANATTRPSFDSIAKMLQEETIGLDENVINELSRSVVMMNRSADSVTGL